MMSANDRETSGFISPQKHEINKKQTKITLSELWKLVEDLQ